MAQDHSEQELPFQLDINYIWSVAKRRKYIILTPVAFGFLIFLVVINLLPPMYEAQTIVAYDPEGSRIITTEDSPLRDGGTPLKYTYSKLQAEIQIMQSLLVLRRVVEKLELHNNPEFLTSSRQDLIKKKIKRWLGEDIPDHSPGDSATKKDTASAPRDEQTEKAMIQDAVYKLKQDLSIEADQYTFLITITYSSTNSRLAAMIANEVPQAHLEHQLDSRLTSAQRATQWLKGQLEQARIELEEADKEVEEHKDRFKLIDTSGNSEYQQQLEKIRATIDENQTKTQNLKIRLDDLNKASATDFRNINAFKSPLMEQLRNQLAEASKKEAELRARLGSNHPQVINVVAEIGNIKRQLSEESTNVLNIAEDEYKLALKSEALQKERVLELEKKAQAAKDAATKFRQLSSSAQVKRSLHDSLVKRLQEAAQYKQLDSTDFRVISKALVPDSVSLPNWILIGFITLIGTGGLGVVIAGGTEFLDSRLRTITQVQNATDLPVISVIPKIQDQMATNLHKGTHDDLLDSDESYLVYTEAINHLKTEVQLSGKERPARTIIVTSPSMNEGKSMLTLAFARHMSRIGLKTLLIDCDLRRPSILSKIDKNADNGLAEVLSGKAKIEDAIISDIYSGLHILPTLAPTGPSASEILGSVKMKDFLDRAVRSYDFVLMDTAPLLPVQDTKALAVNCDAIILVTAWGETKTADARKAVEKLRSVKANILGVVFNKADFQTLTSHYTDVYGYI